IAGYENSVPFTISETIFDNLVVDSMRYYFLQRQGIALTGANAGVWTHDVGHPQDASVPLESDANNTRDVMQGWYDAGDYGKYVNAGATAVSDLLWSYELFSAEFPDNQLNIPESGNGVPDILDEIRWELEWMLKMQDADGGFYHMVKSKGGDGRSEWDSDTTPDVSPDLRFIRDNDVAGWGTRTNVKPTSVTGDAVAALAHAAEVFAPFDAAFANELLVSAEAGWTYLQNNPQYIEPIKGAPYTIPYVDFESVSPPLASSCTANNGSIAPDCDDRAWAAAALYRATGNTQYRDYFDSIYQKLNTTFTSTSENAYGPGLVSIPAVLAYFAANNQTPAVLSDLTNQFNGWRDHMLTRSNNAIWQTTLLDADYYWGSNYPNLTTPLALAVGTTLLGSYDDAIVDLSRKSFNYTLGINSLQFSFVSGYGENSLQHPFSQIYNFDNKPGVPAGIMSGGVNEYNNAFLYSEFPAKNYQDNAAAWSTNEHTVYWNAVVVFHSALAAQEATTNTAPTPTPTPTQDPNATIVPTPTNTPIPPTATPTPAPTATPPAGSTTMNVPIAENLVSGNQTNDYTFAHIQDYALEVVCERQSTGPGQKYDYVDHVWEFTIPAGQEAQTFVAYAWKGSSGVDDLNLAYSADNVTFNDLLTLGTTWNMSQTVAMPAGLSGTIYIRLT
ncbi:MAG TPA: hypothetical protein ENJ56_06480, partial [Anaerolineae bacterium]|nr:hypothetical protein [Anaerolineae bacterium]